MDVLKQVHVVRNGYTPLFFLWNVIVPTCPGKTTARKNRLICVEDNFVLLIRDSAENFTFVRTRIFEQRERLITMCRDDYGVEAFRFATMSWGNDDMVLLSADAMDRAIKANTIPIGASAPRRNSESRSK